MMRLTVLLVARTMICTAKNPCKLNRVTVYKVRVNLVSLAWFISDMDLHPAKFELAFKSLTRIAPPCLLTKDSKVVSSCPFSPSNLLNPPKSHSKNHPCRRSLWKVSSDCRRTGIEA